MPFWRPSPAILAPMRRGASLLELVLVLVIIGITLSIALPRASAYADRLAVHRAALDIVSAHRRARILAVLRSEMVELQVGAAELSIRPRGDTIALWRADGPAATRVALAGPIRTLTFSPIGISTGLSNASFHLTRGAASKTVVVSRLGRVRLAP